VRRHVDVLLALVSSDLRVRYGRGSLRAAKWLLDPVAALGIYLLLVAFVLDRGGTAPGLSIACAVVPFQLVMMTVVNALRSIELRRTIILNLSFPRGLIPLASAVTESIAFLAALPLLAIMMAAYGIAPTPAALWLVPAVLVTFAFSAALAYPAALVGFWFPELVTFIISAVRALFFLAPGLIALDSVSGSARDLLPLNPLTGLFETYRDALLYGQAPAAWEILAPLAAGAIVLALALPAYRREAPYFAKAVTGAM
jgi:lipopolysaccharide transport system permease protein